MCSSLTIKTPERRHPLTIFTKRSILDVCQSSECHSDTVQYSTTKN